MLVCQQCRPTHRSPNQENPVSAQPTGGDQDVDTTKLTHTQTHTPLTVIHIVIIIALLSSLLFSRCFSTLVWREVRTFFSHLCSSFSYTISFIDSLMSPAAESKELCVYVQVALGRHTRMNGWMDGSNEGWLCLKGMREALKDTFTYYPPSSLTTFITEVSKGPFGVTHHTPSKSKLGPHQVNKRPGRESSEDLSSSSPPPHLYISISFLTSEMSHSSVGLQVAHLHLMKSNQH